MKVHNALVGCIAFLVSAPAAAHISLEEPAARYDGSVSGQSKACPCGVGESNRYCDVEGDRSDPDRSNNVTTLVAGSTITMRWDEYVGHSGRYRVAFDADGADHEDFNANILMDFVDPPGNDGNVSGSIWEIEVTVPDEPCDNCTLQLIQMMDGNMDDPVLDTIGRSSYYQCADIVIVPAGGDTGPTPTPDMGTEPQDMGGSGAVDQGTTTTPGADTGTTTTPSPDTGGSGAAPDTGDDVPASIDGTGGCSTTPNGPASSLLLMLFALVGLRRRRA